MKKVKAMTDVKTQTVKTEPKKAHVTLVKPVKAARSPGAGCRPTGVQ